MDDLYHIATEASWRQAEREGQYRPEAFPRDGFVHCSNADQVIRVANRIFRDTPGLLLLRIDRAKLRARLVYENLEGGAELFPHVYGPIDLAAVVRVTAFEPGEDGRFDAHAAGLGSGARAD